MAANYFKLRNGSLGDEFIGLNFYLNKLLEHLWNQCSSSFLFYKTGLENFRRESDVSSCWSSFLTMASIFSFFVKNCKMISIKPNEVQIFHSDYIQISCKKYVKMVSASILRNSLIDTRHRKSRNN